MPRATTLSTNQGHLDEKACSFVLNSTSNRDLIGLVRGSILETDAAGVTKVSDAFIRTILLNPALNGPVGSLPLANCIVIFSMQCPLGFVPKD